MASMYLNRLTSAERESLVRKLCESQGGKCFICGGEIDLVLHAKSLDIDHVVPLKLEGKDDPTNLALTHSSCNRSKQASNLEIARLLYYYQKIHERLIPENRGPNLDDLLKEKGGSKYEIVVKITGGSLQYTLSDMGKNDVVNVPLFIDQLSGFSYFFAKLPIEYLFHDDKINPRSIGQNISKLLQEFYLKRPQLHVSLGWIEATNSTPTRVRIFDGQHKAAAQILLGVRELPVRVFVNPDIDILLTTNTNAGTTLRQVAFDKSVQRHLGSALYLDRIDRYKADRSLDQNDFSFSEKDLLRYFRGESREIKRYVLDAVRDSITHNPDNKLKDYIDFGGKGKERPLSYSTIEKTFYSFFIFQDTLETPLSYKIEEGENPRELEKEQILQLQNIIAEEIYLGKYDSDIGTNRIESRIQAGEVLPIDHVKAFRLSKEEVIYNWLKYIHQIIKNYYIMQGVPINESRLFQYRFPEPLWDKIRLFVKNFWTLPIWANNSLSSSVFGGKQNYDYWQTIFESSKTPQGLQVLPAPINLMEMIQ